MARRFRFSLERVLDYRKQLEDQARMALAKALAAHQAQAQVVADLRSALERHIASLYEGGQVTENDMWLWRRYRIRLEEDIALAERKQMELARVLTKARQDLVAKSKDKKLLEKLRANQQAAFVKEENLKEQKETDEMATLRFQYEAV